MSISAVEQIEIYSPVFNEHVGNMNFLYNIFPGELEDFLFNIVRYTSS